MLAGGVTPPVAQLPLLGSKHAQHVWASYCEDKADDAVLPVDPRSLIQPGVNAGKAVYYNAWWQDCRAKLPADEQRPKTCGDYRTRRDAGLHFLEDELPASPVAAADYNNTWQKWGLKELPANFVQRYTLRYRLNHAPFNKP